VDQRAAHAAPVPILTILIGAIGKAGIDENPEKRLRGSIFSGFSRRKEANGVRALKDHIAES
jgi:hypothetical protein